MSTSSKNPNTIFFDGDVPVGPPTLERLEELVSVWRHQHERTALGAQESPALSGDVNAVEDDLKTLCVGPAATDWADSVKEVWAALEGRWASSPALESLDASLELLLEPLRRQGSAVGGLTAELSLAEARVKTLRVLADLFDELVCSPTGLAEANEAEGDQS